MLVFESNQGAGKSTAVQILAGSPDHFTDALPLGASSQETIELTRGAWIVECAELNGISRREIELIKANLSRHTDRARAAYGRIVEKVPRQWVVVGTTNEDKYLKDETGNRRFWPVKVAVTGAVDLDGLSRDRDQLFAEAACLEARREDITLPGELWLDAQAAQEQRKHENPFVDRLEPELAQFESGVVHPSEIYRFLGLPSELHQSQIERVNKAIASLGWPKKQKKWNGKNQRLFVKENGATELCEIKARYDRDDGRYYLCAPLTKDEMLKRSNGAIDPLTGRQERESSQSGD
jgi:predicted P-loop ATPase